MFINIIYENISTKDGIEAKNPGKNLSSSPNTRANDKFDIGPAAATFIDPYFLSLKLYGFIGTGFAQPKIIPPPPLILEDKNKNKGTIIEPIGSI